MLTLLSTIKTRLAITVTTYDDILTSAIKGVSARFDKETNRTLSRTVGLDTIWPHAGTYEKFLQSDLLLDVKAVLKRYERWAC